MKKLSVLMSVLMASLFFVACDSDDEVTPALKFNPAAVEVVVGGEDAVVEISGGTAPFTLTIDKEGVVEASVVEDTSNINISAVEEGEATIIVKDKDGVEGSLKVTVTAADDSEGDDNEGDDNEGGEE